MPKMDGIEMSALIKKDNPNQKIVIITACDDTQTLKKSIDIQIDKYILTLILSILNLFKHNEYNNNKFIKINKNNSGIINFKSNIKLIIFKNINFYFFFHL